jgi:hypothetical protein
LHRESVFEQENIVDDAEQNCQPDTPKRAAGDLKPTETRLIERCRDIALGTLSGALKGMLEALVDELFELSQKTTDRALQNLYLEAMSLARDKANVIEVGFKTYFLRGFQAAIHPDRAARTRPPVPQGEEEFSLVDPDDLEESIAVQEMAAKLKGSCREGLFALEKRVGVLLRDPELKEHQNPLDPSILADAYMEACRDTEAPLKVRLLFVAMWDRHMQNGALSTYHEVNQYLVEKNILPQIKREVRKVGGTSNAAQIAAAAAHAAVEAMQTAETENDVFATMQQLFSAAAMRGGLAGFAGMPGVPVAGMTGGAPASVAAGMAASAGMAAGPTVADAPGAAVATSAIPAGLPAFYNPMVFSQLTELQHGTATLPEGRAVAGIATGIPPMGIAPVGILRDIKESVLGDKVGHADAMTIEIVAMLFDYIFDDKQVPDPIKALIGRLQIPVLKAAMLDQAFFSKKAHPTRRLLNTLADAATGWGRAIDHESPLYQKIDSLVQGILEKFEDDLTVFDDALADFQDFLDEQDKGADELVEAATPMIVERERRAIRMEEAQDAAEDAVRVRALDPEIPEAVRTFLCAEWTAVLQEAYMHDGENGAPWIEATGTMDDLLWSVQPKSTRESREQLIKVLPTLLRRLKAGMEKAETTKENAERFLSQLVKCHAAAVSAGFHPAEAPEQATAPQRVVARKETAVVLQFPKPQPAASEEVKLEIITPNAQDGHLAVEEITIAGVGWVDDEELNAPAEGEEAATATGEPAAAGEPKVRIDEETARDVVSNLKPGMWVEFTHENFEPLQAKLKWISPFKGTFLFADRQGKRGATMPREKLEAAFRVGSARLLDEAPLLDRAVDKVMATLKRAAA